MSYLQHARSEARANKSAAEKLKQVLNGEIQLEGTQVISKLRTEENFIRDADALLDSLIDNGGKTPTGNKILNSSIREVLETDKIPKQLTETDARRIRQNIHNNLAIKQRSAEALEYARNSSKFAESDAIKYIDGRLVSLAYNAPDNPFYGDMVKFITGKKLPAPPARSGFIANPFATENPSKPKRMLSKWQRAALPREVDTLFKEAVAVSKKNSVAVSKAMGDTPAYKLVRFGGKLLLVTIVSDAVVDAYQLPGNYAEKAVAGARALSLMDLPMPFTPNILPIPYARYISYGGLSRLMVGAGAMSDPKKLDVVMQAAASMIEEIEACQEKVHANEKPTSCIVAIRDKNGNITATVSLYSGTWNDRKNIQGFTMPSDIYNKRRTENAVKVNAYLQELYADLLTMKKDRERMSDSSTHESVQKTPQVPSSVWNQPYGVLSGNITEAA